LVKLYLIRGTIIAAIGLFVVVIGANLFDTSYQSVEPILKTHSVMISDKELLPNQFTNFTVRSEQLMEHNVIIVRTIPSSSLVKLEGVEPNGMTFEKESMDGFLYHIIQRNNQGGSYSIKISDIGSQPVKINVIMGEDPFLSKNCNTSYGIKCSVVQMSMGMVAIGIIAFIVGILIGIYDFKKRKKNSEKIS
jgi:ascorbate-specific PTS system EIIC-type component UlaA